MPKTILIVDADTIAFSAAAVCEDRSVEVTHIKSNRKKIVKTRTEFKEFLEKKAFPYNADDYIFTDLQENPNIASLQKIIKNKLAWMNSVHSPDEALIYISGEGNFRSDLLLPARYKSNRDNMIKPLLLRAAKDYMHKLGAIKTHGEEPDDAIVYKSYEYMEKGYNVIVGSYEKDSRAYSGLQLWDYTGTTADTFTVPDFGSLRIEGDKKKVLGEGFIWYCFQHMRGDISDGYSPYQLTGTRFGEKGAYNLLKDCKNEQEALQAVIKQYITWYGTDNFKYTAWNGAEVQSNYKHLLDLYFKACRMKCKANDDLDFEKFCSKYNVTL
jgi:hypothetical protein